MLRMTFPVFAPLVPGDHLFETDTLVAFHHPAPVYPVHILIVPRRRYASLLDVAQDDVEFMRDLFKAVSTLVRELELQRGSYRLIANGGHAQQVRLLHFHLVAGDPTPSEAV